MSNFSVHALLALSLGVVNKELRQDPPGRQPRPRIDRSPHQGKKERERRMRQMVKRGLD